MKVCGISRVKNEEHLIDDTINHFAKHCNAGLYFYDDVSTDRTKEIIKTHRNNGGCVRGLIEGKKWDLDRTRAEWQSRQSVLELAQKDYPDWICYFDADERIEINTEHLGYVMRSPDYNAVNCALFDAYITKDDFKKPERSDFKSDEDFKGYPWQEFEKPYNERKWFGPEFRNIPMFFRNMPGLRYHMPDQRVATYRGLTYHLGFVKHYGKAISVQQWEDTCDYYIKHFPVSYKRKWKARKGKAIHTKSDFGNDLMTWEDAKERGFVLSE